MFELQSLSVICSVGIFLIFWVFWEGEGVFGATGWSRAGFCLKKMVLHTGFKMSI